MLKLIFNKDDSLFFFKKKLASSRGAPLEYDAKFRFAIHPQGIRQFHDNCKMTDCCHIGASLENGQLFCHLMLMIQVPTSSTFT